MKERRPMKTKAKALWLWMAAMLATTAWGTGAADEKPPPRFYLESNQFFAPAEFDARGEPVDYSPPMVSLDSRWLDDVEIRVYAVENPVDFFLKQRNPHAPRPVPVAALDRAAKPGDMIGEFTSSVSERYRRVFRTLTNYNARTQLKDELGIVSDEPEFEPVPVEPLTTYPLLARWTHQVELKNERYYWNYDHISLDHPDAVEHLVKEGVYLVEATAQGMAAYTVIIVSRLRFADKTSPEGKLLFFGDVKTGAPQSGVEIWLDDKESLDEPLTGKTRGDGTASFKYKPQPYSRALIMGQKGKSFVISDPYYYLAGDDEYKMYSYTERPVYRPNHVVYFRTVVRRGQPDAYRAPIGTEVRVRILDPRRETVYENEYVTDEFGAVHGHFRLGPEPPLGRYVVETSVQGQSEPGYGFFKVEEYRKPEYKVELAADRDRYVAGDKIAVDIEAEYYFGEPVAGGKVQVYVYRARYYRRWWSQYEFARFYASDDEYGTYDYALVMQADGVLDNQGRLSIEAPTTKLEFNSMFRITARVEDASNRIVTGSTQVRVNRGLFSLDVSGDRYSYPVDGELELRLGARDINDRPLAVTVEASIRRTWWDDNWDRQEEELITAEVKIDESGEARWSFTPDKRGSYRVVVSATDQRGNLIEARRWFWVYTDRGGYWGSDSGSIEIIADKEFYKVGDTAHLLIISPVPDATVLITAEGRAVYDHWVRPMEGNSTVIEIPIRDKYIPNFFVQAAIMVNDEFYEGYKELIAPPEGKFLNVQVEAEQDQYAPGDRATVRVKVTDSDGNPVRAQVGLGIVDEAIYAISPELAPDIRRFFFGRGFNQVETSYSYHFYMSSYGRYPGRDRTAAAPGDSLDMADFKSKRDVKVRRNFKDTMFWEGTVTTGADGTAVITAPCPDNLTTWRITARAVDKQGRVGQTTGEFKVRKYLILRLITPRFFRKGDRLELLTLVHNYLDSEVEAEVDFEVVGLTLEGESSRKVTLAPGEEAALYWPVKVEGILGAQVRAYARTAIESDAMELTLPVLPRGMKISAAETLTIREQSRTETLALRFPPEAAEHARSLRVELSPSLAGALFSSLEYLIGYPYGCVEQTMSRFLPTVMVAKAVAGLDLPAGQTKKIVEELPDMVEASLMRLNNMQSHDGGWGWWGGDDSDAFMTAYVVYGLTHAIDAGFEVNKSMYERGVEALRRHLNRADIEPTSKVYMAYVLSRTPAANEVMVRQLFEDRAGIEGMNSYSRALLALAVHSHGLADEAAVMLDELRAEVIEDGHGAHWTGSGHAYTWHGDPIEVTAYALRAFAGIAPHDPIQTAIVRYLMGRRRGHSWKSTRDTSAAIFGMIDYLKASGEFKADFQAAVSINGRELKSVRFDGGNLWADPVVIELKDGELPSGPFELELTKSGGGVLYATVTRNYYTEEENIPASSAGFSVKREYFRLIREQRDGAWVYVPVPITDNTVSIGDEILVKLTVDSPDSYEYFMVEDYYPSGFEPITDTKGYDIRIADYKGYWWYTAKEFRDERAAFFSSWWRSGRRQIIYILRPELPGEFTAMPAVGQLMYFPEVTGNSAEYRFHVVE